MQIKRRAPRKHGGGSQVDDSGPNPEGSYGRESMRHPFDPENTPTRGGKEKIPDELLQDLRRRIAEVKLAELIRAAEDAGKQMDLAAITKEASKKKYGGLIDATRLEFIHADPGKYINQLGVDPADIKVGDKLPSVSDLRKYVRNSLDSVAGQVGKLNKYLFPEGIPLDKIVRSIHFGHGQGLGAGGAHFAAEGLAQPPRDNMGQGSGSGPSGGALEDGRFKVHDAYSAIGHPQFWDEVLSNFIMGRKQVPVLVELTPEGKNRVVHRGIDVDQVVIEEGEIKLRDAITGEPKVKIDPAAEADPLHDYSKHQQKVLESSQERVLKPQVQQVVEHKPTSTMQDTKMLNEWLGDQAVDGRYKPTTTEVGGRLGGIPSTIKKLGSNIRTTDQVAQLGLNIATGDVTGTAVSGTTLAATEVAKTKRAQKLLAQKIAQLTAKRSGKIAASLVPGVGIGLSGLESYGYFKSGKPVQGTVAALSGLIGELPGPGDAISATMDLWNTSQDIQNLQSRYQNIQTFLKDENK
jgi:hypothetical protein